MGAMTLFWSSRVSLPSDFQNALDHEHHIGTAGIIFVKDERDGMLQRPGQDALAELGHLLAVAQDDRVLADQIDTADMAVQVDADTGPVEPRGDLFDMGRFAGAVIALHHDPAVVRKAGQNRACRVGVETICLIQRRHMNGVFRECRNLHVGVDSENLAR